MATEASKTQSMLLKIIFIIGVAMAFVGAVLTKNAFDLVSGHVQEISWYQWMMYLGEIIAVVSGIFLYFRENNTKK